MESYFQDRACSVSSFNNILNIYNIVSPGRFLHWIVRCWLDFWHGTLLIQAGKHPGDMRAIHFCFWRTLHSSQEMVSLCLLAILYPGYSRKVLLCCYGCVLQPSSYFLCSTVFIAFHVTASVVSNSCDPTDCSPPCSSVHGILQARTLEWVALPFSWGSAWPRDWTQVSCIGRQVL